MSLKIMKTIFASNLNSTHRFVALALADFANEKGECWPSISALIQNTGIKERTVRGAISDLKKSGIIESRTDVNKGTIYTFAESVISGTVLCKICIPNYAKSAYPLCKICMKPMQNLHTTYAKSAKHTYREPSKNHQEPSILAIEPTVSPEAKAENPKRKSASKFPDNIAAFGARLAAVRQRESGGKIIRQETVEFYSQVVSSILEIGEFDEAQVELVVSWFENDPQAKATWEYGMGGISKNFDHVLKRKFADYVMRARRATSVPKSYADRITKYDPATVTLLTPEEIEKLKQEDIPF